MSRRPVSVLVIALALLAFGAPALAKEGATTKFDSLPTDWHAGQSYALGYTIRMDGIEPYKADRTEIVATSLDGKKTQLTFPGTPDGAPGHYTATVLFPSSGTYYWKVTQGSFFPAHDLGTINVLPALATTPAAPASARTLGDAAPFAAAVAAIAALAAFARTQRRRRLRPA